MTLLDQTRLKEWSNFFSKSYIDLQDALLSH